MDITREWMRLPFSEVRKAMSPRANASHILQRVVAVMAPAIERYGLLPKRGPYHEAILENEHLRLHFSGLYEDRVLCRFSSKRHKAGRDIDLGLYLFVRFGSVLDELKLMPKPSGDLDEAMCQRQYLDGFNALLLDGWLQEPLEGDFSWVADYRKVEAEACTLLGAVAELKELDGAGWAAIRAKVVCGDYSWTRGVASLRSTQPR